MLLYLLRHAEAEPQSTTDASRKLTHRGRDDIVSVARQFQSSRLRLDRCLCSPYRRAQETATLFLEQVDPELGYDEAEVLTPEVRASEVMKLLDSLRERHVLLVSHNPLVSELCALLTDGDISQMHILGTSELVVIDIDVIGLGMGRDIMHLAPSEAAAHN